MRAPKKKIGQEKEEENYAAFFSGTGRNFGDNRSQPKVRRYIESISSLLVGDMRICGGDQPLTNGDVEGEAIPLC